MVSEAAGGGAWLSSARADETQQGAGARGAPLMPPDAPGSPDGVLEMWEFFSWQWGSKILIFHVFVRHTCMNSTRLIPQFRPFLNYIGSQNSIALSL